MCTILVFILNIVRVFFEFGNLVLETCFYGMDVDERGWF